MFCPQCGKQLPDDSQFCAGCGAQLGEPTDAAGQGTVIVPNQDSVVHVDESVTSDATEKGATASAAPAPAPTPTKHAALDPSKKRLVIIGAIAAVVIIAVIIVLVVVLGGKPNAGPSATPISTEQQGSVDGAKEGTDLSQTSEGNPTTDKDDSLRLVGEWTVVSIQHNGKFGINGNEGGISFAYDGKWNDDHFVFSFDDQSGTYTASGGALKLSAPIVANLNSTAYLTSNNYSYSKRYEGVQLPEISYVIEDISKGESELDQLWFEKYPDDKLTLNVKGTVKLTPTLTAEIDDVIIFEKEYNNVEGAYTMLPRSMPGSWSDSEGNTWEISRPDPRYYSLVYKIKTSLGEEYSGKFYISAWPERAITNIEATRDDGSYTDDLHVEIVSYDGNTLVLRNENSSELTMTRL